MLIFALVYAILLVIPLFKENKGSALLIALAIGLLSLQFNYVPIFFAEIFPNLGIGLSILLVGLILAGALISDERAYKWVFFGLGMLIFLIVVGVSLASYNFSGSWQWSGWWHNYAGLVFFALIIAGVIVAVILGNKQSGTTAHT